MNNKNFSNYSASSILRKVNAALSAKSAPQEDNDVLELLEEADYNHNLPEEEFLEETLDLSEELPAPSAPEKESNFSIKTDKIIEETKERLKMMNEKLISENTAEKTSALLQELKTKSAKNKNQASTLLFDSGETVEDMVRELIKPYLSTWLDQNLPLIVKNIVEKEVKKLIPSED